MAIILAVVAGLFWVVSKYTGKQKSVEELAPPSDLHQTVEVARLPEGLPTDLPIEKDAPIVKNELSYDAETGEIRSTRAYYSTRSIAQNQADYAAYFKKVGWQVLSSVNETQLAFIVASQTGVPGVLQVTISTDSLSGSTLVEISQIHKNTSSEI